LAELEVMKMILEKQYTLFPKWIKSQSNITQENAPRSVEMLNKDAIECVYFDTHFWHMPRAKLFLKKQSLKVLDVPMGFY
jgi:uncharacterized SAM-binding protein YcdF (DUF218 family)